MITVRLERNGDYWRAAWKDRRGKRRSVGLGPVAKLSESAAEKKCRAIEHELVKNPDACEVDRSVTLGVWCERYIASRGHLAAGTIALDRDTVSLLKEKMGAGTKLAAVTEGDASAWVEWLSTVDSFKGTKLVDFTIHGHLRRARAIWNRAVRDGVVQANPFAGIKVRVRKVLEWDTLTLEQIEATIEACPTPAWRALVGLCAYAGLRRKEALAMTFSRWRPTEKKIIVPAMKNDEDRACLLVPELDRLITEAHEAADAGQQLICPVPACNLNRDLSVIIKRAGHTPWPKGFHTLRKWRATTWGMEYPEWVVDAWLDHSMAVARKHYRKPDASYYQAQAEDPRDAEIARLKRLLEQANGAERCS